MKNGFIRLVSVVIIIPIVKVSAQYFPDDWNKITISYEYKILCFEIVPSAPGVREVDCWELCSIDPTADIEITAEVATDGQLRIFNINDKGHPEAGQYLRSMMSTWRYTPLKHGRICFRINIAANYIEIDTSNLVSNDPSAGRICEGWRLYLFNCYSSIRITRFSHATDSLAPSAYIDEQYPSKETILIQIVDYNRFIILKRDFIDRTKPIMDLARILPSATTSELMKGEMIKFYYDQYDAISKVRNIVLDAEKRARSEYYVLIRYPDSPSIQFAKNRLIDELSGIPNIHYCCAMGSEEEIFNASITQERGYESTAIVFKIKED